MIGLLVGVAAIGGGVYLATRKEEKAGGSDVTVKPDNGDMPKEATAAELAAAAVKTAEVLPPESTTLVGGSVAVSKGTASTVIEPGFELEGEGCADAAGGPISCDELSARIRELGKVTGSRLIW